jgi:hypothetical protein
MRFNFKTLLKYGLFIFIALVVIVVIIFVVRGIVKAKKEGFKISDEFNSEFDYVKSFIRGLVGK